MKIGELATRADCDVQTVRYYEREGLLDAPERDASGYRAYADQHLARLQFVRHCRALDIPLADIRQLLAYARTPRQSCQDVNALLDEHIVRVQRQVQSLTALQTQLVALRQQCQGAAGGQDCAIIDAFMSAPGDHACACHPSDQGSLTRPIM
ncbi:Cd(II)/Pb(II)-responsive transcriptional regulator [Ottowia sp.]|uniref:Cd(II)/Pb(II)-responsive transcriptional regulator n=1 Tax=Ottowia sp. TaxID=1898956 RepID=UPI003A8BFDD7